MSLTATRRVVDLSHPVEHGMITYPGLPGPEISDFLSRGASRSQYAPGTEFQIGQITMVANTGTYIDMPFHRYPDGADLSRFELAKLVDVPGVVIDATAPGAPGLASTALPADGLAGRAVLIHTGWDRHWGTELYGAGEHPFLTAGAVAQLVEQGPALVGIDCVNIDDMNDLTRPAHTGLLGAGIAIVEHLRGLEQLPADGFRFHSAPIPVVGMGSFPVRAYATVG